MLECGEGQKENLPQRDLSAHSVAIPVHGEFLIKRQ